MKNNREELPADMTFSLMESSKRIVACAMRMYKKTGDPKYLIYASHFGTFSKTIKPSEITHQ